MKGYLRLPGEIFQMDFAEAETAEDVFRIAKKVDPELYADLESRLPISSPDDEFRHRFGYRRPHRLTGAITRYVPSEMRRTFTDTEWAETERLSAIGEAELDDYERVARELAAEGMRGY